MQAEQVTDPIAFHGEGPVWWPRWQALRMVDMLAGDVLTLRDDGVERVNVGSAVAAVVRAGRVVRVVVVTRQPPTGTRSGTRSSRSPRAARGRCARRWRRRERR